MPDLVLFSDLKAIAAQAKKLKEKELIIAQCFESAAALQELKQKAKHEKIVLSFCHVLGKTDSEEIKKFRNLADFLAVLGGSLKANRFAASSKQVDFLLHPVGTQRFEFDSAMANSARENNVAIALLFSDFLNASQYDRVSLFRNNFLLSKICNSASLPLPVFSGAKRAEEMRASSDLESFLALLQPTKVVVGLREQSHMSLF